MNTDFRLPIGNQAQVGGITLKANGKVDKQEGHLPQQGVRDILDSRVESFIRNQDGPGDLGKAWRNYGTDEETGRISAVISGNFGETKPSVASQFVHIDPKSSEVTIQTQDAYGPHFNHWISANFDPASGKVNPRTISEWVSH